MESIRGCFAGNKCQNMCGECASMKCYKPIQKPINAKCECKYDMEMTTMLPMAKSINQCNKMMWD